MNTALELQKFDKRFDEFLPAIIFDKQNQPFLVSKNKDSETYSVADSNSNVQSLDLAQLKKLHTSYSIIAKKLTTS